MVGRTKGPLAGNEESWPSLFHARLIKPITPSLSDPRDVSRPTHHVSLFSFSSCLYVYTKIFYQLILQRTVPSSSYFFLVRTLALRRCLACLCTAGAVLISPTSLPSLSLSLQCHQPGCRSADNPAARSALIRDKRCFLSAPAVGLGPGWDEALPWPGNPRPAAGSGLLTNGELCRDSDPDPAAEALQTLARASVS